MSAWTMMLCCSLRYFFSLLRTGPTSLLCLTGECESCLVRTRCASHRWRVESSPARTGRMIMLTVWLSDYLILISCLPSPHFTSRHTSARHLPCFIFTVKLIRRESNLSVCILIRSPSSIISSRIRSSWSHQSDGCQMWRKMIWKYLVDWLSFIKSRSVGYINEVTRDNPQWRPAPLWLAACFHLIPGSCSDWWKL